MREPPTPTRPNLRFEHGSATALPLPDASVDVVVSFETIEHLAGPDQPRMLAEIARVLSADGVLVLSAPNPVEYTQATGYRNPFHLHEPEREELDALLAAVVPVPSLVRATSLLRVRDLERATRACAGSVVGRRGRRGCGVAAGAPVFCGGGGAQRRAADRRGDRRVALFRSRRRRIAANGQGGGRGHPAGSAAGRARRRARPAGGASAPPRGRSRRSERDRRRAGRR